ncbi:MAG: hypothetical protein M3P37_06475 [Actinomycetota bacterium]|nr:hypothetical protein [Actinomycetota bacterium]
MAFGGCGRRAGGAGRGEGRNRAERERGA